MSPSAERILTTHAGSLPRPDDLAEMIWARIDGKPIDHAALNARIDSAVDEVVEKQREAGIDVVSDGELSKAGFSTYIEDRFSGFDGRSEFQADDVADFPNLAMRLFATDSTAHVVFSHCVGPVVLEDKQARFSTTSRDSAGRSAMLTPLRRSWVRSVRVRSRSTIRISTTHRTRSTWVRSRTRCRSSTEAITDAGFSPQIDSPDLAMAAHCRSVGSSMGDWHTHLPLAIEPLNTAIAGIPPEQVRLHVCWGNYAGPHHKTCRWRTSSARSSRQRSGRSTRMAATRATSTSGAFSRA
jgi:5-methyltetrahydropteroyltriglutamate--homocysteine methyltransferase